MIFKIVTSFIWIGGLCGVVIGLITAREISKRHGYSCFAEKLQNFTGISLVGFAVGGIIGAIFGLLVFHTYVAFI